MNKQKYIDFREDLNRELKNPEFKKEYLKAQPEFEVTRALIEARIKKGLTQKKLAKKLKTTQSAVSRLESGRANPTISFLQKLATAFDSYLEIRFKPLAT
ncbi:MAG: helix-turn-helix transcriptional regulator [Candidatus Beckwithbacteria bacterium]|nr:helix-turn-helix domain-containing protein [Patescibacteria group bacterium]